MGMFDEQVLGTPSISLKRAGKGAVIEGVILPQRQRNASGTSELVSYTEQQDKDQKTGEPRLYPSGDPIMVGRFLLQTDLRAWEYESDNFSARREENYPDETDTGRRSLIVGSKYLNQAVREAFKRIRAVPEVGGHFSLKVLGVKSDVAKNGEKYTYPSLVIDWTPADDAGRKVADAYAATLPSEQTTTPSWASEPDL